ncbi:MAG: hypothetical protein IT372_31940, partial [Polyangiaceae bacterium]|nr:hypothetical protein [Polyangiaceae bacterium]
MSRVVSRGAIRVDARRAVAKLREHLLVDLNLYLLEIARAAVAGGATRIDVRCDADDVSITFDGAPIEAGRLARLLDQVLDAARDREGRRLRLLALGVNASLGLRPARVDVYSTLPAGEGASPRCARVRFTPAVLDAPVGEGAAAGPEHEVVPAPVGMPAQGVRVEVLRRLGWGVLRRAIGGGVPDEVGHLAAATGDLPVAVTLGGAPMQRAEAPAPLVRVAFPLRGAKRAALEVLPALSAAPTVTFLEHGVRLLEEAWSFAPGFPSAPFQGAELPVRIVVDSEELPTNASRSALREDAPLRAHLREAAAAALSDALKALAAAGCGVGEVPEGAAVLEGRRERLEDALGAIACVVAGAQRAGVELPAEARAVLELPLLRDGLGRAIAPSSIDPQRGDGPLYVWRGKAPLPEELEPWARSMVWLRGVAAERILADVPWGEASEIIERVKIGAERRRALLAHAPSDPSVPPSASHVLRAAFDVREGPWAGLRGEIAISSEEGGARRQAAVRVFVEGRHLETIPIDPGTVPWALEAALEWPGVVRPRFSYEGVQQDDRFRHAVGYAVLVALLAADEEAKRLFGIVKAWVAAALPAPGEAPRPVPRDRPAPRDVDRLRPVLRGAIGAALSAPERLGAPSDVTLAAFEGLWQARIWPTTEPGRFESLQALSVLAARAKGLCVAPPAAEGRAADGRPVLAAGPRELSWISAAIPGCPLVPYERAIWSQAAFAARLEGRRAALMESLARIEPGAGQAGRPVVEVSRQWMHALATPADAAVEVWHHAGRRITTIAGKGSIAPAAIAVDHDGVVPTKDWSDLLSGRSSGGLASIEQELCDAIVAAVEGDPVARARVGIGAEEADPSTRVTAFLLDAAASVRPRAARPSAPARDRDLHARLCALPLVAMLDAGGAPVRASLAEVDEAHPAPLVVPVLEAAPGFETLDWRPVLVRDARERDAFLRWCGGRGALAAASIPERRRIAIADRERRAFLTGPEQDPRALGDLADHACADGRAAREPPKVFLEATGPGAVSVAAALPRAGVPVEHAWADVLFCRRALCRRALPIAIPVVARVDVTDAEHVEGFRDLSEAGVDRVAARVRDGALALALRLVVEAGLPGRSAGLHGEPRALALLAAVLAPLRKDAAPADASEAGAIAQLRERIAPLAGALRSDAILWPTVQGDERPMSQLVAGSEIRAGRRRHVPWREGARPGDLDAPVLFAPEGAPGEHTLAILDALGLTVRDVTGAVEALQRRRAAAGEAEAPRLPGAPAHPRLRMTLLDLDLHEAEGEVEIVEGPESEVSLVDLLGVARPFPADIAIPLRVLARVERVEPSREVAHALLKKIARAAGRHLMSMIPLLDELPPFARAHLRRATLKTASEGKRVAAKAARAPLFADTDGGFWSLEQLREDPTAERWCTRSAPPYPRRRYQRPVLRLSEGERDMLLKILPGLKDVTSILERDRAGEERAAAPQREAITIDAASRARCFQVIPFEEPAPSGEGPPATGEIGLLVPVHVVDRRIAVHVTRRPLCTIDAGEGWPLCAAINDDSLPPNRAFDGLRTSAAEQRLRERVRAAATAWLRARVAPPAGALASRWIDTAHGGDRALYVTGLLWLPAAWPHDPRVLVSAPRPSAAGAGAPGGGATPRPLSVAHAGARVSGLLPVEGALLVWPEGRWSEVAAVALRAVTSMVAEAAAARPDDPAVRAYQWNLRLLGAAEGGAPHAVGADGERVGASAVLQELARRGCLWVTSRRGSSLGHFPEDPPPFVLLDDGGPLLEVLRRRAALGVLRELGGLDEPAEPATPPPPSAALAPAPSAAPAEPAQGEVAPAGAPAAGPRAWMGDLWRTIRSFFAGEDRAATTHPPPSGEGGAGQSELASAVHRALLALGLDGQPVDEVVERRTGRPVRYEPKGRLLVVNPHHPSLSWLRGRGPADAGAIAVIAAAAAAARRAWSASAPTSSPARRSASRAAASRSA